MDDKTIPMRRVPTPPERDPLGLSRSWDETLSYRALFEQTGECIFIISLDFHYITANQQALDLLGYEESELADMPVDEVVSQEDLPENETGENQAAQLQERILRRKDGSTVPVEISTTIVYGDNDEPAYIQSVARDISIRKNTERILKRNALILSIISEATARLLQSSDIDAKLPELLESLGRAMHISCCSIFTIDIISKVRRTDIRYIWNETSCSDACIATMIEPFISQLQESNTPVFTPGVAGGKSEAASHFSFTSITMEGAFGSTGYLGFVSEAGHPAWSQPEMDALQTAANLINAALQRKRFEETIRLSEIRNRIIVDALPDLIIRVGLEGTILDFSANPAHPLYLHRDLAYGRKLDNTFPEEIAFRILGDQNQEAFVSPQKVEEFRLPYAKGTYESSLHPISPEEALIVIRDVTEQVELNEMKSDFINRASHELRTPLTSALLMVELIQEGGTPDEIEECWRTLKAELNRQKELIDRLLMAGRLESGMMKIEVRTLDLVPIVRESMQSVQSLLTRRDISLALSSDQEAYLVQGDKGALQQVFVNLIINAAKFSPEGSQVEIHISHNQTHVNCAIVDKGIGIPQEDLPHLFERFYRARNVTIAEIPGSGIGLYIVHSIVKELGGEITVDSVPDKGTTFTVCLKKADIKDIEN